MSFSFHKHIFISLLSLFLLASCTGQDSASTDAKLHIVATTTIVADVVRQIGGESIELVTLLPIGADPHSFSPSPADMTAIADADLIFANGAGLEEFLDPLIESADAEDKLIRVSDGITLIEKETEDTEIDHAEDGHHEGEDPHTWTDPNNVILWTKTIETALSQADPENAPLYQQNAETYSKKLTDLDTWIQQEVAHLPDSRRKLVTDHQQFSYFAQRYGFSEIGFIIPSFSTMSETSASDLANLIDIIEIENITAIFIGNTINTNLAEQITRETGAKIYTLYTGSLTEPGGEADTYIKYIEFNVTTIIKALR